VSPDENKYPPLPRRVRWQVYAVRTGIGTIDRMKRRPRASGPGFKPLAWADVFGGGSVLAWPLPTAPDFKRIDGVLGFETDSRRGSGGYVAARTDDDDDDGGDTTPRV